MFLFLRVRKLKLGPSGYLPAVLAFIAAFAGFSMLVSALPAPREITSQSKISVETELVLLPVNVTDGKGNFVAGLSLQDFRVYEDGRLQKVTVFEQENTPVTVGLIVDHSRSMRPKLAEVIAAILAFAHSSNSQDEMFVVDFSDNVSLEPLGGKPFTSDAREVERAVAAVSARGQTALYDAVLAGLDHLQLGHRSKKALIIVSDGGDNASRHEYAQVLVSARHSQAIIYSIGLVDESGEEENPKVLERLCKDTGGMVFFPRAGEAIADSSTQIARDLREQYILGYAPDREIRRDEFRKIEVKVSALGRGKIRVRTRPGYSAGAWDQPPTQKEKEAP